MKSLRLLGWALRLQIGVAALFIVFGLWLPAHMYFEHGLKMLPLYDREGHATGQASYFLMGLGVGLFAIALAVIAIIMARRSLRALRKRESPTGDSR